MSEDCVWFLDEKNEKMTAMCIPCHRLKHQPGEGWFWEGTKRGYGDYDLNCVACGKPIHRKEINNEPTTSI